MYGRTRALIDQQPPIESLVGNSQKEMSKVKSEAKGNIITFDAAPAISGLRVPRDRKKTQKKTPKKTQKKAQKRRACMNADLLPPKYGAEKEEKRKKRKKNINERMK